MYLDRVPRYPVFLVTHGKFRMGRGMSNSMADKISRRRPFALVWRCAVLLLLFGATLRGIADTRQIASSWTQDWNSPFNHSDTVLLVRAAAAGGILQLVRSYDPATQLYRLVFIRYEANGQLAWVHIDTVIPPADQIDMKVAADGSAVVTAASFNILFVRKFDSLDGGLIWEHQRTLQTTLNASLLSGPKIARDLAANRILIATADQGDFLIARYAEDGIAGDDVRWGLPNSIDVPTAILLRADGGFVVSGYESGNVHAAYRTLRFDAADALVFSDRETGDIGNLFTPAWLAQDAAGNTYIAGGPESSCGLFTFRIWKLDVTGQRLWTHSGPVAACGSAEPIGFELLSDGSTIVVNRTGVQDSGVLRINADGSTRWARQWGGPNAAHSATPLAFAVNAAGRGVFA